MDFKYVPIKYVSSNMTYLNDILINKSNQLFKLLIVKYFQKETIYVFELYPSLNHL